MEDTPVESNGQARPLTTTSYAVLAVLSLREHSTYELTKQMRLSMHYMWPRAESNMYAEPKRLVAAGLAEARRESTGQRRRTVYSITDTGREALRGWLGSPSSRQRYESEALLKILFAENGTLEDLLASIRSLREDAAAAVGHWQQIADAYEAGEGQYPERFGLSALVARLLGEQQAATVRWAAWAEEVVSRWETPLGASAGWGVETVRATGDAFPAADDPIR
ncbi:MAG TPA: PadR family transcriptional regulator [Gaiellaceae bacterium]|jgi:DNA-binding PadR family transcriptional regulator|nr:PadR family transcriptional regulator [Gaiellaceae bacterium]